MIQSRSIDMRLSTNAAPSARDAGASASRRRSPCVRAAPRRRRRGRARRAAPRASSACVTPGCCAVDVVHDGAGAVAREQHDELVGVARVLLDVHLVRRHVDEVALVRLDDVAQALAGVEPRAPARGCRCSSRTRRGGGPPCGRPAPSCTMLEYRFLLPTVSRDTAMIALHVGVLAGVPGQ